MIALDSQCEAELIETEQNHFRILTSAEAPSLRSFEGERNKKSTGIRKGPQAKAKKCPRTIQQPPSV